MVTWLRPFAGAVFIGAIALRVSERRLIEALEAAGATDPERAIPLSLSNPLRRWQFQRLLAAGAIGETMEMRQYLRVAEYAAFRGRRRTRALIVLAIVAVLAFAFWSMGCASRDAAANSTVRDSAGVEIIEHPAEVIASAPVWTVDTGTHLWTIGGGDDPDQDVDGTTCAFKTGNEVTICHRGPHEVRVYDSTGAVIRRFGRKGRGPGEFESYYPVGTSGDTLYFWDQTLTRLSLFERTGRFLETVSYAAIPRDRMSGVAGRFSDGRLVVMAFAWGGAQRELPDGARFEMPLYFLSTDGTRADSFPGHPGHRQYQGIVYEGGQSYASRTTYQLDGPSLISVDAKGFLVALPDSAIVLRQGTDAAVTRSIRLALPRRAFTSADRERYITEDSIQYSAQQPQFVGDMMKNYREGRFVEFLTPFERIVQGPAGEVWLERSWLARDSTKQYLILDSAGMVAATVTLPMKRTLWWIGPDAVLASWRDADDVRHLSLHPLRRGTAP